MHVNGVQEILVLNILNKVKRFLFRDGFKTQPPADRRFRSVPASFYCSNNGNRQNRAEPPVNRRLGFEAAPSQALNTISGTGSYIVGLPYPLWWGRDSYDPLFKCQEYCWVCTVPVTAR